MKKNRTFTNVAICLLSGILCAPLCPGDSNEPAVAPKGRRSIHKEIGWHDVYVRKYTDDVKISIDGYLSLGGCNTDYPDVSLWDSREALIDQRAYKSIPVDSESANKLIIKKYGKGANAWRVMQGLHVRIDGLFKPADVGAVEIEFGRIFEITRIEVLSNGLALLVLE